MKLTEVTIKRFKQFTEENLKLREGVTIVAGGNNAGKSSLLQALAVWEFCKVAIVAEKGTTALTGTSLGAQGLGIGDDEFSPINIPTLNHLWTNLRSSKNPETDPDGYTLSIGCTWRDDADAEKRLKFSLSLANDRLFVKLSDSNLDEDDRTPTIAYLPPFAGISAREERATGAMRRRRIGEGLAGAVLRNLLLDMRLENVAKRDSLGKDKTRVPEKDLVKLRDEDPWEILQQTLREVFSAEILMAEFNEEYHSYIQANVDKGSVAGYKLTRFPKYKPHDLMVEGSGFLQWLSVYTLATSPSTDILLFDEPDAHLHAALQMQMVERLAMLSGQFEKQVLLATHSTEIIRSTDPHNILEVRNSGQSRFRYLTEDSQKTGLLVGIGSDYAPRIDQVRKKRRVFFYEGKSDRLILQALSAIAEVEWPENVAEWQTSESVKERKKIWQLLSHEYGEITALSLRDRDDEASGTTGSDLLDKGWKVPEHFKAVKWRRRYIEAYLIWPEAIAQAAKMSRSKVESDLSSKFGLGSFDDRWKRTDAAQAFMDARAKDILSHFNVRPVDVAKNMRAEEICEDIMTFFSILKEFAGEGGIPGSEAKESAGLF
ncbi:ATP-dependent nuclease [Glycomyces lechevalierae]|uniref:ATPase n=1 Tax=Glycomyces lechevalierae TaxID=256034 RepID=A0A9X3PLP0_9ACTN|nr:AAA family ATPase [Glycomyces lechevalierae]MDA1386254.1 AAA family ATPase [Glycomyces lechevalierae]MDR7338273.1 putative ATPase [Glycomyces lechevalierae]